MGITDSSHLGDRAQRALRQIAERLRPTRPLVLTDLETTGTMPEHDRIVEIGLLKWYPDTGEGERVTSFHSLINPTVPIPAESTAIHGITDADVAGAPTFAAIAPQLLRGLDGADFVGYAVGRFDLKVLAAEFRRASLVFDIPGRKVIDGYAIFTKKEPRDLNAALRFFVGDVIGDGQHRVAADVLASALVIAAQLERYPDLPQTVDELHAFCSFRRPEFVDEQGKIVWKDGDARIAFGKNAGTALRDCEPSFLDWMLAKDFPADTKAIVEAAKRGEYPTQPAAMNGGAA